ncbi:hypothetical protein ACIPW5_06870 [Streptomyces sp. NPDC090077]|uniref:hypothetical protein n=1 Tax=Streptomyces sp. NPDC090077 TaxID=3365938 RepID=UPI003818DFF7
MARIGESGWVFTLFYPGERPSAGTVEEHRSLFRAAIDRLGLTTVEITPAATADEVLVPSLEPSGDAESAFGGHWDLPYDDLDRVWPHVGLREDAPREVKEVKLRELMRTAAWSAAPTALRLQAEGFLHGGYPRCRGPDPRERRAATAPRIEEPPWSFLVAGAIANQPVGSSTTCPSRINTFNRDRVVSVLQPFAVSEMFSPIAAAMSCAFIARPAPASSTSIRSRATDNSSGPDVTDGSRGLVTSPGAALGTDPSTRSPP